MAFIKKRNSKKEIVRDVPMPAVRKEPGDGIPFLRFNLEIGEYVVSLTEMERDTIMSVWTKLEKVHTQ